MNAETRKMFLVGDNPFHGISHLSQQRARSRSSDADSVADKADLVLTAVKNGADGFMFSVSDLTLSILQNIRERKSIDQVQLHAIVPYAFEYVRIAAQTGTPGLAKRFTKQIAVSGDVKAILEGLKAVAKMDPKGLVKTYLTYEISRMKSSAGKKVNIASVLLHEVITDMGLALNFDWLFHSYISYLSEKGITPGFNTRNFPFLVQKFNEWHIDVNQTEIATPFNKAGFLMNPSKEKCEKTLSILSNPAVLAISVLAAGYLKPSEAVDYIASLNNLKGIVIGVSTKQQASESFTLLKEQIRGT